MLACTIAHRDDINKLNVRTEAESASNKEQARASIFKKCVISRESLPSAEMFMIGSGGGRWAVSGHVISKGTNLKRRRNAHTIEPSAVRMSSEIGFSIRSCRHDEDRTGQHYALTEEWKQGEPIDAHVDAF